MLTIAITIPNDNNKLLANVFTHIAAPPTKYTTHQLLYECQYIINDTIPCTLLDILTAPIKDLPQWVIMLNSQCLKHEYITKYHKLPTDKISLYIFQKTI